MICSFRIRFLSLSENQIWQASSPWLRARPGRSTAYKKASRQGSGWTRSGRKSGWTAYSISELVSLFSCVVLYCGKRVPVYPV